MATLKQFKLPDLGEGLTEGEILRWLVAPGDTVTLNQPIVEVETAKAAVEVPSPYAGTVVELHHGEGEVVDVGTPIITVDVGGDGGPSRPPMDGTGVPTQLVVDNPPDDPESLESVVEPGLIGGPAPGGRTSVLVGYGPKSGAARRRPRKGDTAPDEEAPAPAAGPPARVSAAAVAESASVTAVRTKPPVRKLARDLGVDLTGVRGTGPDGVITRQDVEAAVGGSVTAAGWAARSAGQTTGEREEMVPIRGVRRTMAAAMVDSAFTAPHVTEWLTCDVTRTVDLVDGLRNMPEFAGVRVSPLLIVARALLAAVARYPMVNSTWEEAGQQIVVHHYVNLGIAAATPRGLLVPNIKDAGRLGLADLARALQTLTDVAREGKTAPADMQHGTITITNVGVFGVDAGTPILNPGEAAILCVGAIRDTPWVHRGQIAIRKVTQLALSFDHRIIDGELGSRFLADVGASLSEPGRLLV